MLYQAWTKRHLAEQGASESQKWVRLMGALRVPLGLSLVPAWSCHYCLAISGSRPTH